MPKVYEAITENLYSEQKLYSKYIWLKEYFLETLRNTNYHIKGTSQGNSHKNEILEWIKKFEQL